MSNGKTTISIVFLFYLFASTVLGRNGEVCFPFGSSEMSTAQPQPAQGRPGKVGPNGMPGQKGQRGETGAPGQCACNPNEIEELRSEFRDRIDGLYEMVKHGIANICGVGLKNGLVKDDDITASSTYSRQFLPRYARLDRVGTSSAAGGWLQTTAGPRAGEWVQVDLKKPTRVVGVVTQGRNDRSDHLQWTTSYKISFGNSTNAMQAIEQENGSDLVFQGNRDRNSHVTNDFPAPITARYFRLIVQSWNDWPVVRLEYLTC